MSLNHSEHSHEEVESIPDNPVPTFFRWVMPSIGDLLFIMIFLLLLSLGARLLDDGDTGWHIRIGEQIWKTFSIPHQDLYSYTMPDQPWFAWGWLSDVIFAVVHKILGLNGIVILSALIFSLTFSLLFRFLLKQGTDLILSAILVIIAASASTLHCLARPHIFSLLLTLIWFWLLDQYQTQGKKYLYFLPLIMLFWVNLHGGFVSGFIILFIYLLGNLLTYMTGSHKPDKLRARAQLKSFALTGALCLVVAIWLNPYGYKLFTHIYESYLGSTFLRDYTMEFKSPDFHAGLGYKMYAILILLIIMAFGVSLSRTNFVEIGLIITWTYMSLYSARNIPLFAIIAAPIIGRHAEVFFNSSDMQARLSPWLRSFLNRFFALSRRTRVSNDLFNKHLLAITAVLIVGMIGLNGGKVRGKGLFSFNFDSQRFPVAALKFIKSNKIRGNMFNEMAWGGFLIYALYPEYKVFIDGRGDMYGGDFAKTYTQVAWVKPGWKEVLHRYNVNWIIYPANSQLSVLLIESKDWKLIYADRVANIFVRNIPQNEGLIKKYPAAELAVDER